MKSWASAVAVSLVCFCQTRSSPALMGSTMIVSTMLRLPVVVCQRSVRGRHLLTVLRPATESRGRGIATERTTNACPDRESGQA